ncbi:MAG: phenylalanine--tRNA ligase subunit beta [Nitrososphaerota archaeon]|nr:phenylalanine--tRNA ligase subunit beta [Nitrososphaerota archaeon]
MVKECAHVPIVTIYYNRIQKLLKQNVPIDRVIEALPYLGLDLEEKGEDYVKVEYNPNRPDFSTDYGIARALNGLFGFEKGAPIYDVEYEGIKVFVDDSVKGIRPYIVSLVVKGLSLDDETIRQMITMQEDLHAGIGRKRRKVSIGIHNLDVIHPPLTYTTVPPDFRFVPLNHTKPMSMEEVLRETDVGREYGGIVAGFDRYPIIIDARGEVLSFPPIINGELTRVTTFTKNLLIDITGTDLKAMENSLAILAATFHDAGGRLKSVEIGYSDGSMLTPDMAPTHMPIDLNLIRRLLGLNLSESEVKECLERSRISVMKDNDGTKAVIPRYRVDIIHPVDLVEEVVIGYGVYNLTPKLPRGNIMGRFDEGLARLDRVRDVLTGFGLIEVMNFSLVSREVLYDKVGRRERRVLRVESPRTKEHEVLRDQLLPSLIFVASKNLHEEYPQRIFEVAKVCIPDDRKRSRVREEYHVAVLIAHAEANYSEAKSLLTAFVQQAFNKRVETKPVNHYMFTAGRVAEVIVDGKKLGYLGEVHPKVLNNFDLRVPAVAFELNLELLD